MHQICFGAVLYEVLAGNYKMEKTSGTRIVRKIRAFHIAQDIAEENLGLIQLPVGEFWSGSRNNA